MVELMIFHPPLSPLPSREGKGFGYPAACCGEVHFTVKNAFLQKLCKKLLCKKDGRITPGKLVSFVNPYSYLRLRKAPGLLGEVDAFYADGILLVWMLRLLGVKRCERVSFDMTSLAPAVLGRAQEENLSVYIIGTTPELIGRACQNIMERFPGLNLAGRRHGYFSREDERRELIESIKSLAPGIVIAGMGTPLQEAFLRDLRAAGWGGAGFTCGGFLHQTAKRVDYYPGWMDRLNLRWLYRIYDEPRVAFRYLFMYPVFLILCLRDYLKM